MGRRPGQEPTTGPRTSPAVREQALIQQGKRVLSSDGLDTSSLEPLLPLGHWNLTHRAVSFMHVFAPSLHPQARTMQDATEQERTPAAPLPENERSPTAAAPEAPECEETCKDGRDDREECAREASKMSRQLDTSLKTVHSRASSLTPASPRLSVALSASPHLATTVPLEPVERHLRLNLEAPLL